MSRHLGQYKFRLRGHCKACVKVYKMDYRINKMKEKRGQVTIFIIIAVIIVALAFIVYFFVPGVKNFVTGGEVKPDAYLKDCIEDELLKNIETISLQGGSLNPELSIMYKNQNISYLCYTNEYYKTCVVQEPMLIQSVADELANSIEPLAKECVQSMTDKYESQGYDVNLGSGNMKIELMPNKAKIVFDNSLSLTKGDTRTYDSIEVLVDNNLYELLSIADNIIGYEARYGNAETTLYMQYYRNLKVEKDLLSDGTKIYTITDRNTLDKFQFASRSLSWPPGYGTDSIII